MKYSAERENRWMKKMVKTGWKIGWKNILCTVKIIHSEYENASFIIALYVYSRICRETLESVCNGGKRDVFYERVVWVCLVENGKFLIESTLKQWRHQSNIILMKICRCTIDNFSEMKIAKNIPQLKSLPNSLLCVFTIQ